jgi:hypothetical protein
MNKIDNKPLVIALIVLTALTLYFAGGAMMGSGINVGMNGRGWIGGNSWGWLPALLTFGLAVFIGWLLQRKKA